MQAIWLVENSQFSRFDVGQLPDGVARRIIAAIKEQIHGGVYQPGDRLPSTRAFATEWGASRTTVTAAYGQLIAEGYLTTRPGSRAIVAQGLGVAAAPTASSADAPRHLSAFAQRLLALPAPAAAQTARIADFRYGDLSGADFPVLAWRRAFNKISLRRAPQLRYGDPQGSAALRNALQAYLWRARGISCAPDQIVIVNGSQQGLDLCARLLLDPGDPFVIENPGYVLARHCFVAAGGLAVPVPVDADGLRTDSLPSARLAYVTPSHQFPLGSVLSAARRRALLAWAARTGAYVVEDDYDGEYRHDIAPIPPLQTLDAASVIYAGTLSKTLSPTLRLGYLVVPASLSAEGTPSAGRCCCRRWQISRPSPSRAPTRACTSSPGSTASRPTASPRSSRPHEQPASASIPSHRCTMPPSPGRRRPASSSATPASTPTRCAAASRCWPPCWPNTAGTAEAWRVSVDETTLPSTITKVPSCRTTPQKVSIAAI
jgi:GntR family transcriptional regulator/MocR family aminotransferase